MASTSGDYTVTLLLKLTADGPLQAVEQYGLTLINHGISGYAFRVVSPQGETFYVMDSDVLTPEEFEAEYMSELEEEDIETGQVETVDLPDEPLVIDHPAPTAPVEETEGVVSTTHLSE